MPPSHRLRPPALRGDDPLGFLAAVGVVALAEQMPDVLGPIRLSWEGSRTPKAIYESECDSLDALGERLRVAFESSTSTGGVLPGVEERFPTKKVGAAGGDPMRSTAEIRVRRDEAFARSRAGDPWLTRWLSALAAPVAVRDGNAELTRFYAPAGQMTLRGNFDQAVRATARLGGPGDALSSWRRVAGYHGANLDGRAVRTAEFRTDGKPSSNGAPSPTWLGLVATRFFPVCDDGRRARTTGWLPLRLYRGYTRRSLVWPIWTEPLDAAATRTICATAEVTSPVTDLEELKDRLRESSSRLRGLGVSAVFGAGRRTADQADGPLGRAIPLWTAS